MRYTVKQVSRLTGVSAERLRAWERRYGVVTPGRSPAGYRLYGDDDVARLRQMAQLVEDGVPASLAAEQVLGVQGYGRQGYGATPTGMAQDRDGTPPAEVPTGDRPDVDDLLLAARTLDLAALDRTLDEAFALGSFESVVDAWLTPALARLGEAWASGEVDVSGEHFVSAAVERRLSRAFEAAGVAVDGPVVAVGLPPGAQHDLAALAFATSLRRRGADARYLGRDLPVESWVQAVRRLRPAAVALAVPLDRDAQGALEVVQALSALSPAPRVFAGGRGTAGWDDDHRVTVLPGPVTRSAHDLATALVRRDGLGPNAVGPGGVDPGGGADGRGGENARVDASDGVNAADATGARE